MPSFKTYTRSSLIIAVLAAGTLVFTATQDAFARNRGNSSGGGVFSGGGGNIRPPGAITPPGGGSNKPPLSGNPGGLPQAPFPGAGGGGGGGKTGGGYVGGRHHVHGHGRIGVGPGWVGGDYYYANDCYWLKRKALHTGSRYWRSRYNACLYGY